MSEKDASTSEAHETPEQSLSCLPSMFKSLLDEMKSMNRKMDSLAEPINLDDEDKDYEVEEEQHGEGVETESLVLLDTKVTQLPARREPKRAAARCKISPRT